MTTAVDGGQAQQRRFVVLVGNGEGPKVAFRSEIARLRIRGLVEGGNVKLRVDDGDEMSFVSNGIHSIPGGQFAKASSENKHGVICDILTGEAPCHT